MTFIYLYSTLTAPQKYSTEAGPVLVAGGANLTRRGVLDTPRGVATRITAEQYKALKDGNALFAQHVKNGFVVADERKNDPDVVAQSMSETDKSAQKTEAELKDAAKEVEVKVAANRGGRPRRS